jgi:hypothetical protein
MKSLEASRPIQVDLQRPRRTPLGFPTLGKNGAAALIPELSNFLSLMNLLAFFIQSPALLPPAILGFLTRGAFVLYPRCNGIISLLKKIFKFNMYTNKSN